MNKEYSGHILVVDDELSVLRLTAQLLESAGFTVTMCSDSTKALDLLGDLEPDLLITDVRMPQITGTELAKTMHRFAVDIPVIIMTGYAEVEVVIEAIRQHVFDVILKPYRPEDLFAAASRAISHYRRLQILYAQAALASNTAANDQFLQEISSVVYDLQKNLEQLQSNDLQNLEAKQLLINARMKATSLALAIHNRQAVN